MSEASFLKRQLKSTEQERDREKARGDLWKRMARNLYQRKVGIFASYEHGLEMINATIKERDQALKQSRAWMATALGYEAMLSTHGAIGSDTYRELRDRTYEAHQEALDLAATEPA